jgi:D-alanyl-D-alanine carboxypeptidase (penicillin-binding protein 5/6)
MWLLCWSALAAQPDPFPQVAASYLVEIDGEVVWQKQPQRPLPPASLTKLMTALLVLEQTPSQTVVNVSKRATMETGSRIGLKVGEQFALNDLLAAALLASANDACRALAEHIADSETAFVARMNQRAKELDMQNTHFLNACGHDASSHYSTTHDLAVLAKEVLKHPQVLEITSQVISNISTINGARHYALQNKNALIGRYRGAVGLKTGYTPEAGKCLVAYAKRDGHEVLLVLLHGNDRWWDAVDILDLAFDHAHSSP